MAPKKTPEKTLGKRPAHQSPQGLSAAPTKRVAAADGTLEPPESLELGTMVEALDCQVLWYPARIVGRRKDLICVSFGGWTDEWNEWLHKNSPRLRKYRGWGTLAIPNDFQVDSIIEALDMEGKWYRANVLHVTETKVMVHYKGWPDKWNEWIDKDSLRLRQLQTGVQDGSARVEGNRADKYDDVCGVCEEAGELLCCEGPCMRAFHRGCVAANNPPPEKNVLDHEKWKCADCRTRRARCFGCKRWGADRIEVHRCGKKHCGKAYHIECLTALLQPFSVELPPTLDESADDGVVGCSPCEPDSTPRGVGAGVGHGAEADEEEDFDGEAEAELEDDDGDDREIEMWQEQGHPWIERRVRRFFDGAVADGILSKWLPPQGRDAALWHMDHDDGDEEDLDGDEVRSALHAYKANLQIEPVEVVEVGGADGAEGGEAWPSTPRREVRDSGASSASHTTDLAAKAQPASGAVSSPTSVVRKYRNMSQVVTWAVKPTCPRHWCVVCKEAESMGYGEAMVTCVRCSVAVHRRCAPKHSHALLSTRAMLCERCEHDTPKGLSAPDPVIELSAARKGVPLLLPPGDGLESDVSFAPFVSQKLAQKKVVDWWLPASLEQALKERTILPVGDFAPKPYATLRRSVYKHNGPREKLDEDDVEVCFCTPMNGGCDERCQNRAMQHQCDPSTCPCGEQCSNRPFASMGATSKLPLQLFKTIGKGWGVKSTRELCEGELVVEYVGEVIDVDTWEARKTALWRFEHMYFMAMSSHEIVDATNRGNIARFINHSCNPNLQVEKWYVNRTPRLGLWAKRPIAEGEELTYNYSVKWNGDPDSAQRCYCGSKRCTGYLGAPPKAMPDPKAKGKAGGKAASKGR